MPIQANSKPKKDAICGDCARNMLDPQHRRAGGKLMTQHLSKEQNTIVKHRVSNAIVLCPICGYEPSCEQTFCTRCGSSLTRRVECQTMQGKWTSEMPFASKTPSSGTLPANEGFPLEPARSVNQRGPGTGSQKLAYFTGSLADSQDNFTAAWAEEMRTDAVALPIHLIPSRSEEAKVPADELPSQEAVKRFVQMWRSWRAECYLVIASVLLGVVTALAIWGK
jgi:hypothetical protein